MALAPILWQRTEIAGDQTITIPEVLMPIGVSKSSGGDKSCKIETLL